jgi:hypothetical protein
MNNPNTFSETTKRTLAQRAGHICSNPFCRAKTSGPKDDKDDDEDKTVVLGEAAHIRGDSPGSARYEAAMLPEERRVITNGIWLCCNCSELIDNNPDVYSVERLFKWKREHETNIYREIHGHTATGEFKREIESLFSAEPAAALQLALDQPDYWEYLLTAELLRSKVDRIKKRLFDLDRGLAFKPHTFRDGLGLMHWLQARMVDLESIGNMLNAAVEELNQAWGEPGFPGDPFKIKDIVGYIYRGCEHLLDWETEFKTTIFPDNIVEYKEGFSGITEQLIGEIERISKDILSLLESDKSISGEHHIDLEFKLREDIHITTSKILTAMRL